MFHTVQFLTDNFRSAAGLHSYLSSKGHQNVSVWAIDKWFRRGAVPSEWFATILCHLEREDGKPVSLKGYLE